MSNTGADFDLIINSISYGYTISHINALVSENRRYIQARLPSSATGCIFPGGTAVNDVYSGNYSSQQDYRYYFSSEVMIRLRLLCYR